MKNKNEKISGGLFIKEEKNDEKISGGLFIKEEKNDEQVSSVVEKEHTRMEYTSIPDDKNSSIDINIPKGSNGNEDIESDNYNPEYSYYPVIKKNNKGIIIAASLVSITAILASIFILNRDNPGQGGTSTVSDKGKPSVEDTIYDSSGKTVIKDNPKKPDTKVTSSEKSAIEDLFENFYDEHIYATNYGYYGYVMDYLTQNGDYRTEYEKLMENHAEMTFELMDLKVLSIMKQNNNTYMVTVKDKIKVDRPENISIQACKTVYEVRKIDDKFLIHSIKSETKIKDESKILETKVNDPDTEYEDPDTGYEDLDTEYEDPDTGYEDPDTEYEDPDTEYEDPDTGYDNQVDDGFTYPYTYTE